MDYSVVYTNIAGKELATRQFKAEDWTDAGKKTFGIGNPTPFPIPAGTVHININELVPGEDKQANAAA